MELISIAAAARMLPRKDDGKRHSLKTITRWITQGCRGIKLWGERVGNRWHTTSAAIDEFRQQLTQASLAKAKRSDVRQRILPNDKERQRVRSMLRKEFGFDAE